jgi:hypothetical protein
MMKSYHVYASAKPGVGAMDFENRMKDFLDTQIAGNHLCAYQIMRFDSNSEGGNTPEYQIICDYASGEELKKGFEGMKHDRWRQDPHAGMMELVGEFRVAFSEDVSRSDVR